MAAQIAEDIRQEVFKRADIDRIKLDRDYMINYQNNVLKPLLTDKLQLHSTITQIYFQFVPEITPYLGPDEFSAGICLENRGDTCISEHNPSYIRDFNSENTFLKWWFFEPLRMKAGGWTRPYYDPYLLKEVVTYSLPFLSSTDEAIGVLGIDIDSEDFRQEMSQRLVSNIKDNIENIKKDYEFIGDTEFLSNRYIDVNTLEVFAKEVEYGGISVKSPEMLDAIELAVKASETGANILLQGETGVGKDHVASYIHSHSQYSNGPFLNVNCVSIPESLLESEFFGYAKGAFTGANNSKAGLFEAADGGTIFLNEIGDIPLNIQGKFLNVIQNKEVMRIGETVPRKTDFRLITATNKNLYNKVQDGSFRMDLYYRLHVIVIEIPPLRRRREDLYALIDYFYRQSSEKYNKSKKFSHELISRLMNYAWPGNIRELENLIERLVVTSPNELVTKQDLPPEFLNIPEMLDAENQSTFFPPETSKGEVQNHIPTPELTLKERLEETEKQIIIQKYKELGSSYKVAAALGISQTQAWQKIKKYAEK